MKRPIRYHLEVQKVARSLGARKLSSKIELAVRRVEEVVLEAAS